MRNSTKTNIQKRIRWLDDVASRRTTPPSEGKSFLTNLKLFCKFTLPKEFEAIAYNTLKNSSSSLTSTDSNLINENGWETLKDLLERARHACAADPTPLTKDPLPPPKEVLERTLLDAHICSMAYLELYTFLKDLSQKDISTDLKKTIDRKLEITTAKFKLIISHSDNYRSTKSGLRAVTTGDHDED